MLSKVDKKKMATERRLSPNVYTGLNQTNFLSVDPLGPQNHRKNKIKKRVEVVFPELARQGKKSSSRYDIISCPVPLTEKAFFPLCLPPASLVVSLFERLTLI